MPKLEFRESYEEIVSKVKDRESKGDPAFNALTFEEKKALIHLENQEALIRSFKKAVIRSGILDDYKRHEAFYPKSLRRKMKSKAAKIKRSRK